MTSHRRGPWSQSEDAYLTQLVHTQGPLNWVRIAQLIGSRSPKQCRERYHQNLKPTLNHEPISPEEGLLIERLVSEIGKRWAEIARRLHGRSDNAVKNWWNGSMNRRRRLVVRRRTSSRTQDEYEEGPEMSSYSRHSGHHHQPLTITSPYSSGRRHIDQSLPSPVVSEASRAESISNPPSLVSDSGSRHSTSPRGHPSLRNYITTNPPDSLFFGKTKVMAKALGSTPETAYQTNTHLLAPYLAGNGRQLLRRPKAEPPHASLPLQQLHFGIRRPRPLLLVAVRPGDEIRQARPGTVRTADEQVVRQRSPERVPPELLGCAAAHATGASVDVGSVTAHPVATSSLGQGTRELREPHEHCISTRLGKERKGKERKGKERKKENHQSVGYQGVCRKGCF
ncbi:hypothetical protein V494_06005 [Pseudogymnoascus sp. VKM F-4513 (FW-928)]|nr:hypothetical protein V494_06005 [Pseudogymnoascus sp. VKM F-4513 (FW-928)]